MDCHLDSSDDAPIEGYAGNVMARSVSDNRDGLSFLLSDLLVQGQPYDFSVPAENQQFLFFAIANTDLNDPESEPEKMYAATSGTIVFEQISLAAGENLLFHLRDITFIEVNIFQQPIPDGCEITLTDADVSVQIQAE